MLPTISMGCVRSDWLNALQSGGLIRVRSPLQERMSLGRALARWTPYVQTGVDSSWLLIGTVVSLRAIRVKGHAELPSAERIRVLN